MKKLLLWSGGFDSTALVIDYLSNNEPFDLCYCILPNNKVVQDRELRARRIILKKLLELYPNNSYGADYLFEYVCTVQGGNRLPQPYIWATTLAWNLDIERYNEVVMGYISNDDFWHVRNEFEQLVNISLKLLKHGPFDVKLSYPYEWRIKQDIYEAVYKHHDLGLILKDIEMCENIGSCDIHSRCGSCRRHLSEFGHIVNGRVNYTRM